MIFNNNPESSFHSASDSRLLSIEEYIKNCADITAEEEIKNYRSVNRFPKYTDDLETIGDNSKLFKINFQVPVLDITPPKSEQRKRVYPRSYLRAVKITKSREIRRLKAYREAISMLNNIKNGESLQIDQK
jgi:hypothetical protein